MFTKNRILMLYFDSNLIALVVSSSHGVLSGLRVGTQLKIPPTHAWRRQNMEMFSTLLAFCKGNPLVTGGFPTQKTSNVELWCCFLSVEHTMDFLSCLMWRHCNGIARGLTETEMSFWRNFRQWLHWKLSFWQLPMQPVTKSSSTWQRFSVQCPVSDNVWHLTKYLSFYNHKVLAALTTARWLWRP